MRLIDVLKYSKHVYIKNKTKKMKTPSLEEKRNENKERNKISLRVEVAGPFCLGRPL